VRGEELFLAIDVDDAGGEAGVRLASAVERTWLDREPLATANLRTGERLVYSPARRQVEARLQTTWIDLVLDETPITIRDTAAAATLLAREAVVQSDRILPGPDTAAGSLLARTRWLTTTLPDLGLPSLDAAVLEDIVGGLCHGLRSLDELARADWMAAIQGRLGYDRVAEIDRLAPTHLELPTGRRLKLAYDTSGPPILAARIQELFGVRETPRVAGGRVPVLLHLLGPNHRPQQVTADLAGFWQNTYPQVKKELRRRYPKHAWPDDPLQHRGT
jgi:ATP-dependent helicase HrpB